MAHTQRQQAMFRPGGIHMDRGPHTIIRFFFFVSRLFSCLLCILLRGYIYPPHPVTLSARPRVAPAQRYQIFIGWTISSVAGTRQTVFFYIVIRDIPSLVTG